MTSRLPPIQSIREKAWWPKSIVVVLLTSLVEDHMVIASPIMIVTIFIIKLIDFDSLVSEQVINIV